MNTLRVEAKLAQKYGYKPLPGDLPEKYHQWYIDNLPDFCKLEGDNITLYSMDGTAICDGYDRIVVGDYGAFIEFSEPASYFKIRQGQEFRVKDPYYASRVKYAWLTTDDDSDVKIYLQKRTVAYADYKPGKYYVSPHEVKDHCFEADDE